MLDNIKDKAPSDKLRCEHLFVVISKKVSPSSEHATQFMCQKCCHLVNFADVQAKMASVRAESIESERGVITD